MSDKTEGGDIDWAKLERETVAAAVKPFEVAKAKSDAEFGASLRAAQAELDRLLAARKTAEKQALEERCAMEKLPPVVRADIERGVTTAPIGLFLMGIDKLCTNDENMRRLDTFIKNSMQWLRISYTTEISNGKLKELLPMLKEHIGNAKDDEEEDVFVLNPDKPKPTFVVAIGAGPAKRNDVKHDDFVFIKDGKTGDFKGEKDVISLGEWVVYLHIRALVGEQTDEAK